MPLAAKLDAASVERLIHFVRHLEAKLTDVKSTHEQLQQLLTTVSETHESILEELTSVKTILNDEQVVQAVEEEEEEEQDRECDWDERENDEHDADEPKPEINASLVVHPTPDPSQLSSSSITSITTDSRPASSNEKRSSNLKRPDSRSKSAKSVSFSFDEKKETPTPTPAPAEELLTPVIPYAKPLPRQNSDLMSDLFHQHHREITHKPTIGYKMGNALSNIRIHEIEPTNGEYLRLLNISNSDDYDLSGHFLQQNVSCSPVCRFRFPYNTIIRAGQTVTVWCGALREIEPQPPHLFVWKEQRRWETGPECVTILAKPNGQAVAWARSSQRVNSDQSSSDILFVQSKATSGTADGKMDFHRNRSRLSSFDFIGKDKPPFAHSPTSAIHPDCHGTNPAVPNDLRSQMHQRTGLSQLLTRPKSSPFASHAGCQQDLISLNVLRNAPSQEKKLTTLKT